MLHMCINQPPRPPSATPASSILKLASCRGFLSPRAGHQPGTANLRVSVKRERGILLLPAGAQPPATTHSCNPCTCIDVEMIIYLSFIMATGPRPLESEDQAQCLAGTARWGLELSNLDLL